MRRTVHGRIGGLWAWCAAIVGLSVLVGSWNAVDPHPAVLPCTPRATIAPTAVQDLAAPTPHAQTGPLEQIESTLAQAGCPGWMVLASEGQAALEKPPKLVPSDVKETALRVAANVPRVTYPRPLRVANRTSLASGAPKRAKLAVGAVSDPDDLLDGVADLLTAPAKGSGGGAESPAAEGEGLELDPPVQEPVFPETAAPAKGPQEDLPPQRPSPIQEEVPTPSQPAGPGPQTIAPFAPPAPPNIEQPQPIQVPVAPPIQQRPPQSPFIPPPAPMESAPHSVRAGAAKPSARKKSAEKKTYCEFIAETQYPSAQACAKCHEKLFDEWSVSSHAYAAISPMFHKFEQKINDLSQGTVGYFCYRCHAPVGTTLGVSRAAPLWELPLVAREGVTCIACHRVNQRYGKVNGERRIEPGDIHAPVYGSIGGGGVAEVIAKKSDYKVKTSPSEKGPGQDIHVAGVRFDQLSKSEFCVSCHQVAVHPGIKLEVVWEQYRASPACKKGVSCQDCHMGRIPGVASGYELGAAAKVGDKIVNSERKHANHVFYGPGYSIAHPGIFPHNIDANRWSMKEWLLFEWRVGWGTDKYEELLEAGRIRASFPPVWAEADDRYDAREIIDDNFKKLDAKKISRQQLMENGSHVDGPFFDTQIQRGQNLKFHYVMTNTNSGHNLPSGSLGAQPQLWANVVLIGPRGQRRWESGYTDRWGDVADIHSEDVRHKRIPYDWQLFNLQTMFLITGSKGTDREFFLPVNLDIDQLPYLRPGAQPISVINHPPFIRMEGRSLPPLGSRKIPYKVPAEFIREPGHYRLSFRLRSRAEPIYFMRFCGSTQAMDRAMNEGIVDFHQSSIEFLVK